ncbi:MAG: Uma2 family endonuclease [Pseudonocardia sp.]
MSTAPDIAYRWTREQYDRAVDAGLFEDTRVELLDGEIVVMSPQKPPHAATTRWLRTQLARGLDPLRWLVGGQDPIALSDLSEPEPDVWVARPADVAAGLHPAPRAMALVVEVSYSSQYVDRTRKLPLYAAAGVPEYWIVDLHRRRVDVHRSPSGRQYAQVETVKPGDVLTVPAAGLAVDVAELLRHA